MSSLRRRWPIIAFVILGAMALGAGWAALQTPSFRAEVTVEDPNDEIDANSFLEELSAAVAANEIDPVADTVSTGIGRDGSTVQLVVDADVDNSAYEVAQLYAELAVQNSTSVALVSAAEFPLTPRSPNLRNIALLSAFVGMVVGALAALLLDRLLSSPADAVDQSATSLAEQADMPDMVGMLDNNRWLDQAAAPAPLALSIHEHTDRAGFERTVPTPERTAAVAQPPTTTAFTSVLANPTTPIKPTMRIPNVPSEPQRARTTEPSNVPVDAAPAASIHRPKPQTPAPASEARPPAMPPRIEGPTQRRSDEPRPIPRRRDVTPRVVALPPKDPDETD